ncbi:MAG TPA: zf-HC2 domain-containing protein, partial [Steroidobacteraceae bacterium]|nr:zf-HC2 domain-containing protein [Steroidobacteraceae bacterium]
MQCAEALRVQAYFDGEVDAVSALEVERHAEHCAECRALLGHLAETRARIREELEYAAAPAPLCASIDRLLDRELRNAPAPARTGRVRPKWRLPPLWLGASGGFAAAAAAALAIFFLSPLATRPVLDDLVSAHVRSLMPMHL